MNQQPDHFFREKLEGFQKPAPASAWEKIEAAQQKKSHNGLWLKFAASLLLLAVVTYVLWPFTPENKNIAVVQPAAKLDNSPAAKLSEIPKTINTDATKEQRIEPVKPKAAKTNIRKHEVVLATVVLPDTTHSIATVTQESRELETSEYESAMETNSLSTSSESITLVFTATEVNNYLYKKDLTQATDSIKKTSKWKQLLKKANDLTNNQDPFGELRQKKNEILALNFKNEKQRDQNK